MITARLYLWLGAAAIIGAVALGIYGKGRLDAAHKAEVARLELNLRTATQMLELERTARQQDAIVAAENARRKAALQQTIKELDDYVASLEDRDRECLSGADIERLRNLWPNP